MDKCDGCNGRKTGRWYCEGCHDEILGEGVRDLIAENEKLREQVRLLRSALKGVSFWQSQEGYYCYDMAHCLQSEARDKHHDCEIANKALQATEA